MYSPPQNTLYVVFITKNSFATKEKYMNPANSLVFYYINGGTIKILRYIFNKVGLQELNLGYLGTLFMLFCSIACISVVVLFIRKYCPIVIGDKVAFNNFFGKRLNACKKESF